MDDNLREFLEKFAELERRTRRLAVEDRSLRDEVKKLRERLAAAEAKAAAVSADLEGERDLRQRVKQRVDELLERLAAIKSGAELVSEVELPDEGPADLKESDVER